MKAKILDQRGKKVEDITLTDSVFGVKPNKHLLAQYIRVFRTNQRQGTSSTKTRSEVSGSGAKPWAQKGLGRARAGTKRSPLWRHGGVINGPKPKTWSLNMPKKMKLRAFLSALSQKNTDGGIYILEKIEMKEPKTKEAQKLIKNLKLKKKVLFVTTEKNENFEKSISNLTNVTAVTAAQLNVYEVLTNNCVVFEKKALQYLQKKYKG